MKKADESITNYDGHDPSIRLSAKEVEFQLNAEMHLWLVSRVLTKLDEVLSQHPHFVHIVRAHSLLRDSAEAELTRMREYLSKRDWSGACSQANMLSTAACRFLAAVKRDVSTRGEFAKVLDGMDELISSGELILTIGS